MLSQCYGNSLTGRHPPLTAPLHWLTALYLPLAPPESWASPASLYSVPQYTVLTTHHRSSSPISTPRLWSPGRTTPQLFHLQTERGRKSGGEKLSLGQLVKLGPGWSWAGFLLVFWCRSHWLLFLLSLLQLVVGLTSLITSTSFSPLYLWSFLTIQMRYLTRGEIRSFSKQRPQSGPVCCPPHFLSLLTEIMFNSVWCQPTSNVFGIRSHKFPKIEEIWWIWIWICGVCVISSSDLGYSR